MKEICINKPQSEKKEVLQTESEKRSKVKKVEQGVSEAKINMVRATAA